MNDENKEEKIASASIRVIKNFAPALTTAFQQIGWISPEFNLILNSVSSIVGYYGDFANDRTLDFLKQFADNKERLVQEIVHSEKFKAVFIKTLSDNITESNEEKRQLLKNYILNFARGVEVEFNEHTKLLNTLNTITGEELAMLKLWDEDGLIKEDGRFEGVARITVNDIKRIVFDAKRRKKNAIQDYENHLLKLADNKDAGNQILLSLGYKDLLYVLGENNFGSGEEAKVNDITNFGKVFLNFIKK